MASPWRRRKCGESKFSKPYIGGEEVNSSPTHAHHRYVINFGERSEEECRREWPELMGIVERKVKSERDQLKDNADGRRRKNNWWQFGRITPALDGTFQRCCPTSASIEHMCNYSTLL